RGIIEGFWRLYTDDFYTIYLPVPPIEEQKEIMQYIGAHPVGSQEPSRTSGSLTGAFPYLLLTAHLFP
ncbi:restriction endonuclease subunit S, partial [Gemmiger formicilis]|uniref:restriction endonuclease subunit S n=1 Tax=Gemmiger formicilis TaxID=745368 RepID=UPI00195A215E